GEEPVDRPLRDQVPAIRQRVGQLTIGTLAALHPAILFDPRALRESSEGGVSLTTRPQDVVARREPVRAHLYGLGVSFPQVTARAFRATRCCARVVSARPPFERLLSSVLARTCAVPTTGRVRVSPENRPNALLRYE